MGKIHWRKDKLPTPVFWPGEFQGLYSPWGLKEPDTIEGLSLSFSISKDKYLLFSNNKLFLNNTYLTLPQNKWHTIFVVFTKTRLTFLQKQDFDSFINP